jgi:hypothetical protein
MKSPIKNKSCLIQIKVINADNKVSLLRSRKKSRIINFVQKKKNKDAQKYMLRVTYGKLTDSNNKKVLGQNEGEYFSKSELLQALDCFTKEQ